MAAGHSGGNHSGGSGSGTSDSTKAGTKGGTETGVGPGSHAGATGSGSAGMPLRGHIHGLYPITPDCDDDERLLALVEPVLHTGIRVLQYRNKAAGVARRRAQIAALLERSRNADVLLIVNDDWRLALDLGASAIHVGRDDGDPAEIRRAAGPGVLIGVSCYGNIERARQLAPVADYLAFGAMFPSGTKPQAPPAPLSVLGEARQFGLPVVAIGGIGREQLAPVLRAGADAAAVIGAVFGGQPGASGTAARELARIADEALQA